MNEHFFGTFSSVCPKPLLAKPRGKFGAEKKSAVKWL
jgi:hypothetical protein